MQVSILGPLEVVGNSRGSDAANAPGGFRGPDGDGPALQSIAVAGSRLRRLLTRLAWQVGTGRSTPVSPAELVDAVWFTEASGEAPADPANALQSLVSRLRRLLGSAGSVRQLPGGYRLDVAPDDVDIHRFSALAAQGHQLLAAGDAVGALDLLDRADRLWRGRPLIDADDAEWAVVAEVRLTEDRLAMLGDLFEANLLTGRSADVLSRLDEVATVELVRERFTGQLMRALAATGRTADALAVYSRLRDHLAEELGVDPTAELQALHVELLRGELAPVAVIPTPTTPSRSASVHLRSFLTSFLGREEEMTRVAGLLDGHRLATIVGPGGAGKTRLAAETARTWAAVPGHGNRSACMVELAPVGDEAGIEVAFLDALGQRATRAPATSESAVRDTRDYRERIIDRLDGAEVLLVVDNCEHLLSGVAELLDDVLARCPQVHVLTTSREPLGMVGEALCALAPLGLPPLGTSAAGALEYPSVRLLVERAAAVNADFAVNATTVDAVVQIVRRLDGLPLAIELAAARLRVLPIAEIAARLDDRFRLLSGGNRTALPRHRTLRAVVDWSWDLLSVAERTVAERLSIFPAGATPISAAAVCPPELADDIPDVLLALADKSLLQVDGSGELRYRMLETIREFGLEKLIEQGIAEQVRTAHASYFAQLAARLDPIFRTRNQLAALHTFSTERENLLTALRFLADRAADERQVPVDQRPSPSATESSIDMVMTMVWYWVLLGAQQESIVWLDIVLAATKALPGDDAPAHPRRIFVEGAWLLAAMTTTRDDWADTQTEMKDLLDRLEPQFDTFIHPMQRLMVIMLSFLSGDGERSAAAFDRTVDDSDEWVSGATYLMRANFAENFGNTAQVAADIEKAYPIFDRLGERWGLATVLQLRGNLRSIQGQIPEATEDLERAWQYTKEIEAIDDDFVVLLRLADLKARIGDVDGALELVRSVRAVPSGSAFAEERRLMADAAELGLAILSDRDGDEIAAAIADLRANLVARTTGAQTSALNSHIVALLGAMLATIAAEAGDIDQALVDATAAFSQAIETKDQPIMALAGTATARLATAMGDWVAAAEILGAAAALRGADDATDLRIAAMLTELREALGERFDEIYGRGKSLGADAAIERIDPASLPARIPAQT